MTVPLESAEQIRLTNWLDINNYKFSAIRNESDFNNIVKWVKRKKEWVRKWISDFCVILKRWSVLFIELKRQQPLLKNWKMWKSPSTVSKEQIEWVEAINSCWNTEARICYGAENAIKVIKELELK